jgi:hypothetical protein
MVECRVRSTYSSAVVLSLLNLLRRGERTEESKLQMLVALLLLYRSHESKISLQGKNLSFQSSARSSEAAKLKSTNGITAIVE